MKKRISTFLYDHPRVKATNEIAKSLFLATIGAVLYAFAFSAFIVPSNSDTGLTIVTGGIGGITQVLALILKICGSKFDVLSFQAIFYFAFNIPIIIFAFICVGKRFALVTCYAVGLSSLFISVFDKSGFTASIASNKFILDSVLSRAIFAGMIIGTSSAITYRGDASAGGIDVICYYTALKKSTSIGKYSFLFNVLIVATFTILSFFRTSDSATPIVALIYSIVYQFVNMLIVDFINIRNKKVQLQIITSNPHMNDILISNFSHGTTIVKAYGGFSGREEMMICMNVPSIESKSVLKVIKAVDPSSFVTVVPLVQIYGNFFNRPVK